MTSSRGFVQEGISIKDMTPDHPLCAACEKPTSLCVCAALTPVENRVFTLILRHPQEQDRELGTAPILTRVLTHSLLKTGLSWPSLSKILGRTVDPKRWGILYLGTAKNAAPLPPQPITVITRNGNAAADQATILQGLEGIILLDGSWAQAKALWWRNAWMLKCPRLIVQPPRPSLYGHLRKEPRRESVSTLEAAAYVLAQLEKKPELAEAILTPFRLMLDKARASAKEKTGPKNRSESVPPAA